MSELAMKQVKQKKNNTFVFSFNMHHILNWLTIIHRWPHNAFWILNDEYFIMCKRCERE